MTVLRWALFLVFALCLVISFARMRIDGVTVLGALLFAAWAWTVGAFRRDFWFGTPEQNESMARVDQDLDQHR